MFADDQSPAQPHDSPGGASLPKVKHLPSDLCASIHLVLLPELGSVQVEGELQQWQRHDVRHSVINKGQGDEAVNVEAIVPQQVSSLLVLATMSLSCVADSQHQCDTMLHSLTNGVCLSGSCSGLQYCC